MSTIEDRLQALEHKVQGGNYKLPGPARNVLGGVSAPYRVPANFVGIANIRHTLGTAPKWVHLGTGQSVITLSDRVPGAVQTLKSKWTAKSIQLYLVNTGTVPENITIILGT